MRVSMDEKDSGFKTWVKLRDIGVYVFLDGDEVQDVITADDDLGYILKYTSDDAGDPVVIDGNEWAVEELAGAVEIVVGPLRGASIQ